jgi:hypothetical protein
MKRKMSKKINYNMLFLLIVLIIYTGICIGLYFAYKYYNKYGISEIKTVMLIDKSEDAETVLHFSEAELPRSTQGQDYNINTWLYIDDYLYRINEDKIIIERKLNDTDIVNIKLDKHNNDLIFTIASRVPIKKNTVLPSNSKNLENFFNINNNLFKNNCNNGECGEVIDNVNTDSNTSKDTTTSHTPTKEYNIEYDTFTYNNVSLQKWVNINLSLVDGIVDIYVNGKLVTSIKLKGLPFPAQGHINVTPEGGFNGYITRLSYTNKGLAPNEINSIVKKGPGV